jgi:hypothetical protein
MTQETLTMSRKERRRLQVLGQVETGVLTLQNAAERCGGGSKARVCGRDGAGNASIANAASAALTSANSCIWTAARTGGSRIGRDLAASW